MNYESIEIINKHMENYTYVNPCEAEDRTFRWEDAYFGHDKGTYFYEEGDSEYAEERWEKNARMISTRHLTMGCEMLTLSYNIKSVSKTGNGRGGLYDKYKFKWDKKRGFVSNWKDGESLQELLGMTEEENQTLIEAFNRDLKLPRATW